MYLYYIFVSLPVVGNKQLASVLMEGAMGQPYGTRGQRAARDPPKLCRRSVRVFEHIWVTLSHQNDNQWFGELSTHS
jgi:hypothetical protein